MTLNEILCVIFLAIACLEAVYIFGAFVTSDGTLTIDETNPEDVKWRIALNKEVTRKQRIYILKIKWGKDGK